MSKPQHPYPLPVRATVAETIAKQVLVMREWSDLTAQTREAFLKDADQVLDTLWDASRVDTLDELEELPKGTVLIDKDNSAVWLDEFYNHWEAANGATFIPSVMVVSDGAPLRVIYWGDSDE